MRLWPVEYKEVLEEMVKYMKFTVGKRMEEGSVMEKNIEKREAAIDCINRRMSDNYARRLNRV
jgi:hypothetical protein